MFCFSKNGSDVTLCTMRDTCVDRSSGFEASTDRQELRAYSCMRPRLRLQRKVLDPPALKSLGAPADQIHVCCSLRSTKRTEVRSLLILLPLFTHIASAECVCMSQSGMAVFITHKCLFSPPPHIKVLVKVNTVTDKRHYIM